MVGVRVGASRVTKRRDLGAKRKQLHLVVRHCASLKADGWGGRVT